MTPKQSNWMAVSIGISLLALWSLPLVRATSFAGWALDYDRETQSIDSDNQLRFAFPLLFSYLASAAGCLAIAWMTFKHPSLVQLASVALAAYAVVIVLRIRPEQPFHLLPAIRPWQPAQLTLVAVIASAGLAHFLKPALQKPDSKTEVRNSNRA